ncbi:LOW QUALITY PROTEIN: Fido domain containing protein [Parasponia andersonii]|uniref:Fido domain containing protein n=1 Tax=Parasponia andersonii TaxID=3476 RepID=A0A2P5BLL9_PARAD|nr:LOW QUALITY PROTEIN: Fido domain containing protein [Parasponia andersonii]
MGSSLRHIPDQMLKKQWRRHSFSNNFEKENQGSEQLDHEPNETGVLDEDINVSKKIHQFYFVKFRPHQEPSSESKIEKAEKLIQKLNRDEIQVTTRIEETELTRDDIEVLIKKRAEVRTKTDQIKNKLQSADYRESQRFSAQAIE